MAININKIFSTACLTACLSQLIWSMRQVGESEILTSCTVIKEITYSLFYSLSTTVFWCRNCLRHKLGLTYWYSGKNPFYLIISKWVSMICGLHFWLFRFYLNTVGEWLLITPLKACTWKQYIVKTDLFNDTWRRWTRKKNNPKISQTVYK